VAFVEQITLRIPRSKARKSTNSAQAWDRSLSAAGYFVSQVSLKSRNCSVAAGLGRNGADVLESLGDLVLVLSCDVGQGLGPAGGMWIADSM
jgi:hypothetical protein